MLIKLFGPVLGGIVSALLGIVAGLVFPAKTISPEDLAFAARHYRPSICNMHIPVNNSATARALLDQCTRELTAESHELIRAMRAGR